MTTASVNQQVSEEIIKLSLPEVGLKTFNIYRNILRELIAKFGTLKYSNGNNEIKTIKCFHASQERAIGAQFKENNIKLPVISITEIGTEESDERRRYTPLLLHEKYFDPKKERAIRILSLAPKPVNVNFQINIWSEYKADLDLLRSLIMSQFNPALEISVENHDRLKLFLSSEEDNSIVSVEDGQDKLLRKTFNISAETYIIFPKFMYTSTGRIEKFNYEVELTSNNSQNNDKETLLN